MKRCVVILAALLIPALLIPVVAEARDVEDITVGIDHQRVEIVYPAIPASSGVIVDRTPGTCKSVVFCDTIDFKIEVPASYGPDNFYTVKATLYWDGAPANDLHLYLTDPKGADVGASTSLTAMPEEVATTEPPAGLYHLVVYNRGGTNAGYRIVAVFNPVEIPENLAPPPRPGSGASTGSARPAGRPGSPAFAPAAPAAQPPPIANSGPGQREVRNPGADGQETGFGLNPLKGGKFLGIDAGSSVIVWPALFLLIATAGAAALLIASRRRSARGEAQ